VSWRNFYNASYTIIGDNINILCETFQASKDMGKTWQIWGGATNELALMCYCAS